MAQFVAFVSDDVGEVVVSVQDGAVVTGGKVKAKVLEVSGSPGHALEGQEVEVWLSSFMTCLTF
jgi:hypothetical protein